MSTAFHYTVPDNYDEFLHLTMPVRAAIRNSTLRVVARALLFTMWFEAFEQRSILIHVSQIDLARWIGASRATTCRAIAEAVNAGWITRKGHQDYLLTVGR